MILKMTYRSNNLQSLLSTKKTIEMLQRPRTLKVNCCLKVHNVHLKLAFEFYTTLTIMPILASEVFLYANKNKSSDKMLPQ